jgi:hypothetical protein
VKAREIGPVGTALRVVTGLGFLYLAGAVEGGSWDVDWFDPLVGFIALPGVMLGVGLIARRYASGPVHFTGVLGHAVNAVVIVGLLVNPYTAGGAVLFYGATMLVAAWRGQRGCEGTVIANLILQRDDQVGCPLFWPADEAEARWTATRFMRARHEIGRNTRTEPPLFGGDPSLPWRLRQDAADPRPLDLEASAASAASRTLPNV